MMSIKKSKGFTLIEVIIALGIISIILVASLPVVALSFNQTLYSKGDMGVTNAINQHLEHIRSLEFNQVGNVGSNPSGILPVAETILIENRTFIRTTVVNWVSESIAQPNTDYKSVSVRIAGGGYFKDGSTVIDKEVTSFFSRDSEQSPLSGGAVLVYAKRGWQLTGASDVPVQNLPVQLNSTVNFTDSNGRTNFFNLTSSDPYDLIINANSLGMINLPNQNFLNLTVENNHFYEKTALVDFPSAITIKLVDLSDNAITLPAGLTGVVTLEAPYVSNVLTYNYNTLGINGEVALPTEWSKLWPVGAGFAGRYSLSITHPDYVVSNNGIIDESTGLLWDGTFIGPGTTKNLKIVMRSMLEPPIGFVSNFFNWINGNGNSVNFLNATGSGNGIPVQNGIYYLSENDPTRQAHVPANTLLPYIFQTENPTQKLFVNNTTGWFFASSFHVQGTMLEIKGDMRLASNVIVFQSPVELAKNSGDMKLATIHVSQLYDGAVNVAVPPYVTNQIVKGELIGGKSGVNYGQVHFQHDVIKSDVEIPLVKAGLYYFPNGFNLSVDHSKSPLNGGLIRR